MSITLADISRSVSLTPASVSKILSGYPGFSEKTRERVLRTAEEMGYRPNLAARGLLQKKSLLLGVSDRKCNGRSFVDYLDGIQAACLSRQYAPLVFTHDSAQEMDHNLQLCLNRRIDGLLITAQLEVNEQVHLGELETLLRQQFPIVEVHGHLLPGTPSVCFDYHTAGRLAADHLLELGHRQIAIFPDEAIASSRPRAFWYRRQYVAGCCERLAEAGLSPALLDEPVHIASSSRDQWMQAAYETTDRLLRTTPRPTAMVCMGETEAVTMYHALRERQVNLPTEFSLVSHTQNPVDELLPQFLTTVQHDARAVGEKATELLFQRLDGQTPPDVLIAPRLLPGQSTAPCRGSKYP